MAIRVKPTLMEPTLECTLHLFYLRFKGVSKPHVCLIVPNSWFDMVWETTGVYMKIIVISSVGFRALGTAPELGPLAHGQTGMRERSWNQHRRSLLSTRLCDAV